MVSLARADQLGRAVGLPETFLSKGEGGGVIQGSASEGTLVGLLAARTKALKHMRKASPGVDDHELLSKMTLYTSDQVRVRGSEQTQPFWITMGAACCSPFLFCECVVTAETLNPILSSHHSRLTNQKAGLMPSLVVMFVLRF